MANDANRDKKMTVTVVILAVVSVIGGLYALWGYLVTPPTPVSQVDLNKVGSSSLNQSEETPEYRALLEKSNKEGEEQAKLENSSFIASIPLEQSVIHPKPPSKPSEMNAEVKNQPRQRESRYNTGNEQNDRSDRQSEQLKNLIGRIKSSDEQPAGLQLATVIKDDNWNGGNKIRPAQRVDPQYSLPQSNSVVVPAYYRGAGEVIVGVDSDNASPPVLARFLSGPYAGAILKAPGGAVLSGNGVMVHFTEMALGGTEYKIDAYALDQETLTASISTDVNNRYFSRIILPSLLKGIGGTGDLYAQANTQVVSNGLNTTTSRPDSPDGKAVAGIIVGGTAGQAAKVLSQDAARLPVKQVTVKKGQVIAIQFVNGVYSGDRTDKSPRLVGDKEERQEPVPENTLTEADWRNRAQERIDAQQALRKTNRNEYDE